jgi:hypothetical protein
MHWRFFRHIDGPVSRAPSCGARRDWDILPDPVL